MPLYPFEMQIAVDANNPDTVVQGGNVTIVDPADATNTPIPLLDPAGLAMANPIATSQQGFIPAFQATIPHVKWHDGTYAGYLSSYKGLLDEAIAAREAAQQAVVSTIPAGGTSGQVLAKSADANYAIGWTTVASSGAVAVPDSISGLTGATGYGRVPSGSGNYAVYSQDANAQWSLVSGDTTTGAAVKIYNTVGAKGRLNIVTKDRITGTATSKVYLQGGESTSVPYGSLDLSPAAGSATLAYTNPSGGSGVVACEDGGITLTASTYVIIYAPSMQVPAHPTTGRPTAAAAGAGGHMYDTTLSKPIWSDGTTWRDAAGTAV